MQVWTNNRFEGFWPVGTAAVVVADTADQAAQILNDELGYRGLPKNAQAADFLAMITDVPAVRVLCDGDY